RVAVGDADDGLGGQVEHGGHLVLAQDPLQGGLVADVAAGQLDRVDQPAADQLALRDPVADQAGDPGAGLDQAEHQPAADQAGGGGQPAVGAVEGQQGRDVDVGQAVAVGDHEGVVVLDVAADPGDAAAGHGVLAGVGQGDLEVLLAVAVEVVDAGLAAQLDPE